MAANRIVPAQLQAAGTGKNPRVDGFFPRVDVGEVVPVCATGLAGTGNTAGEQRPAALNCEALKVAMQALVCDRLG